MPKSRYQPPEQGPMGMVFDALLVLILVFVSLSAPLWLANMRAPPDAGAATERASSPPTWETLGQNATMAAQWEKLGKDPVAAAAIINKRFDYSVNPLTLGISVALLVIYYFGILRLSEREYREVIAEKFDE